MKRAIGQEREQKIQPQSKRFEHFNCIVGTRPRFEWFRFRGHDAFFCEDFCFFLLEGKKSESFMIRTYVIGSESTGNGTLNCDKYFLFLKRAIALQVFGKAKENL